MGWHYAEMRTLRNLFLALLVASTGFVSPAMACSVPPVRFEPSDFKGGVILQGVIENSRQEGRMTYVTIKVDRVVQGSYEAAQYSFSFYASKGGGACPPPGTHVLPNGQKLVVYLERRDSGLWRKSWLSFDDAKTRDYRVRTPTRHNR